MKYVVICSTGELNVSLPFQSYSKARSFALGFKRGVQLWDMEIDVNLENITHRGFRFGQIMAYYCERHYISQVNLKAFVEALEDENVDGRTNNR
jgi:hypothetical protein